jgi:hypothetical protein
LCVFGIERLRAVIVRAMAAISPSSIEAHLNIGRREAALLAQRFMMS